MKVILLILFVVTTQAVCSDALFADDPLPWGGAPCKKNLECGGADGGVCDITPPAINGTCVCPSRRGNPDCSYQRHGTNPAGGLNVGLPFVGIGGVGNFILGHTGNGVGQLLLILSAVIVSITACCLACCECGQVVLFIMYGLAVICIIAGFIWSIVDGAAMLECRITDALGYALYKATS